MAPVSCHCNALCPHPLVVDDKILGTKFSLTPDRTLRFHRGVFSLVRARFDQLHLEDRWIKPSHQQTIVLKFKLEHTKNRFFFKSPRVTFINTPDFWKKKIWCRATEKPTRKRFFIFFLGCALASGDSRGVWQWCFFSAPRLRLKNCPWVRIWAKIWSATLNLSSERVREPRTSDGEKTKLSDHAGVPAC